jgi:hypothetical protein
LSSVPHLLAKRDRVGVAWGSCRRAVWTINAIRRCRSRRGKLSQPGSSLPGLALIRFGTGTSRVGTDKPALLVGCRIAALLSARFLPLLEVTHEIGEVAEPG